MEKLLLYVAVFCGIIFIAQTLAMLIGFDVEDADMDSGVDIDTDAAADNAQGEQGHGFGWFTIKNIINFFLIFSLVGLTCIKANLPNYATIILSTVCGVAFVYLYYFIMKTIMKLNEDGTSSRELVLGKIGTMYLRASVGKPGKISIIINGTERVIDAIIKEGSVKTGESVKVVAFEGPYFVVEKIKL